MKDDARLIGLDLGGTSAKAGLVQQGTVTKYDSVRLKPGGSVEEIMSQIYQLLDRLGAPDCRFSGIGIGAPSVVDVECGIVYDTQNIPSWKDVPIPLASWLGERYKVPVHVNNDANCFILGEKYWGKAKGCANAVGVTLGTGMGSGIIINHRLYSGRNCGAGEFGMISFRDHVLEYYSSGQFFTNVYGVTGEVFAERAARGDREALVVFDEFGKNVGEAIKIILYAVDPDLVLLGGSASRSFPFFEAGLRESLKSFVYPRSVARLRIDISETPNVAILGAASLCLEFPA